MNKLLRFLAICMCVLILSSCGPNQQTAPQQTILWSHTSAPVKNNCFEAIVTPSHNIGGRFGYLALTLTIENKSDKDIEIDWNKTACLFNGRTDGGFMFEGIMYKDRNMPKMPDIVLKGSTFSKQIYPNNLVAYSRGGGWLNQPLPRGEIGVYLVATCGKEEIREKLMTTIRVE